MHSDENHPLALPRTGNWQAGELAYKENERKVLAADYAAVFKGQVPPADALTQYDALFPFTETLRQAAATRPEYRLNLDYNLEPPSLRAFGPLTEGIKLAQIVTGHAMLALDHGQSDKAAQDVQVNFIVARGTMRDPSLVGGLVAIGVVAISDAAIYHGLAFHHWSDAQLAELEKTAASFDFLNGFEFAMHSEGAFGVGSLEFVQHGMTEGLPPYLGLDSLMPRYWPAGWWDQIRKRT